MPDANYLQGYANEELASITFDVTNASGTVSNQMGFMKGAVFDTNRFADVTDYFQCYDLSLTNGTNRVTLHAVDLAGNVTTTNFVFNLNYATKTNPPVVQIYWPTNGTQIGANSFTMRGWLDDFTVSVSAQITDTNGDTNTVAGVVERNGNFWVDNIPLAAGTNFLTLTATDAAGNVTTTNLNVVQSSVVMTINPTNIIMRQALANFTGTMNTAGYKVWVNGVVATQSGSAPSISWTAVDVPVNGTSSAVVQARAIPTSDNGGNGAGGGGGGTNSTLSNPGNPAAADAADSEMNEAKTTAIFTDYNHTEVTEQYAEYISGALFDSDFYTAVFDWSAETGGSEETADCYTDYNIYTGLSYPDYNTGQFLWDTNGDGSEVDGYSYAGCGVVTNLSAPGSYTGETYFNVEGRSDLFLQRTAGFYELKQAQKTRDSMAVGQRGVPGATRFFSVSGNVQQIIDPSYPYDGVSDPAVSSWRPIPLASVTILGQTEQGNPASGYGSTACPGSIIVGLPAGETGIDVTPRAASYFYYVEQPASADDMPLILWNGTNDVTSGNATVIVGEEIHLTCTNASGGLAMSNYSWTIPGITFSNYIASSNSGTLYTNFPKTNSDVIYYWADGGSKTVSCSVTVDGQTMSAQTTFNVIRPTAQISATVTGQIAVDTNWVILPGSEALHFGGVHVSGVYVPGIKFQLSGTDTNGTYLFLQTGTITNSSTDSSGFSFTFIRGPGIDNGVNPTGYTYPFTPSLGTNATGDAPGVITLGDTNETRSDSFRMYLMFIPNGINSEPVPLQYVSWSWSGSAIQTNSALNLWSLTTSNYPSGISAQNTTVHPQWTTNLGL